MSLTIVCLPHGTPTGDLADDAAHALRSVTLKSLGVAGHFITGTRLHRNRLLQPWQGTAAGGPVQLLDVDAMRAAAQREYWYRWHIWHQVVAPTRPAQPYWTFAERHLEDPRKYSLAKAQQQYRAQPRIAAMLTYNALPNRVMDLPTADLEAFQTGAHGYASLGWLTAVPGNALLCLDGSLVVVDRGPYATRLARLAEANRRIDTLHRRDALVALCTR
ncbi:hypothetical protein ACQP00_21895 [Dactylosporangium sp. CS-047395]|uniref:hypothetical protein n=1 Tax=Dactylosporangium sp. CS-047395 TaxID=3239936 RepID=UPI003D8D65C7